MPKPEIIARLKKGRERPVTQKHPWIFSGAIASWEGNAVPGSVVNVQGHDGTWLARGLANPTADLAVRLYTWNKDEAIDDALFEVRLASALALRERLFKADGATNAYRLVFSEADGISGLIVDRYADALSVRVGSSALMPHLSAILGALAKKTDVTAMCVVADRDAIQREGLDADALPALSRNAPDVVRIRENGFQFDVDLKAGQKTGFYLDQRVNRQRVAAYAAGRRVLSAYCYTGAFEVYAAAAGAQEITGIDSSESALEQANRHMSLNGVKTPATYIPADVPAMLRKFRDEGRTFDLIILDPPRFVANAAQKDKGLRAYKDINLLAMKLLTPGGILATFSCSGLVSAEDLKVTLGWAEKDSGRSVRLLEQLGQPPDHPILLTFPESEYLAGFIATLNEAGKDFLPQRAQGTQRKDEPLISSNMLKSGGATSTLPLFGQDGACPSEITSALSA